MADRWRLIFLYTTTTVLKLTFVLMLCTALMQTDSRAENSNGRVPVIGALVTHAALNDPVMSSIREGLLSLGFDFDPRKRCQPTRARHSRGQGKEGGCRRVLVLPYLLRQSTESRGIDSDPPLTRHHVLQAIGDSGRLMSYGNDQYAMYRRLGYYVDRILKGTPVT